MNCLVFDDFSAWSELCDRDSKITVHNPGWMPWIGSRWAAVKQVPDSGRKPEHGKQTVLGQSLTQIRNCHVGRDCLINLMNELICDEAQEVRALVAQRR